MKIGEAYLGSHEQRFFDMSASVLIAAGGALPVALAATVLCIERGEFNPIFRQHRVGRDSKSIMVPKIRTMADQEPSGVSDTFGAEDPRASKVGRLVRRLGIDEIPQVASVFRGELNLVGVRPQIDMVLEQRRKVDAELFDDWYYWYERNPGILGAGQSYAHEVGNYRENSEIVVELMQRDIANRETASLATDAACLAAMPIEVCKLVGIKIQEAMGGREPA